jgi:hypothetical protein
MVKKPKLEQVESNPKQTECLSSLPTDDICEYLHAEDIEIQSELRQPRPNEPKSICHPSNERQLQGYSENAHLRSRD